MFRAYYDSYKACRTTQGCQQSAGPCPGLRTALQLLMRASALVANHLHEVAVRWSGRVYHCFLPLDSKMCALDDRTRQVRAWLAVCSLSGWPSGIVQDKVGANGL